MYGPLAWLRVHTVSHTLTLTHTHMHTHTHTYKCTHTHYRDASQDCSSGTLPGWDFGTKKFGRTTQKMGDTLKAAVVDRWVQCAGVNARCLMTVFLHCLARSNFMK